MKVGAGNIRKFISPRDHHDLYNCTQKNIHFKMMVEGLNLIWEHPK